MTRNIERDTQLSQAFDAGNYAEAYSGLSHDAALARAESRDWYRSEDARAAFTLGYFANYARTECGGDDLDTYDSALAMVGADCVRLGFIDAPCTEHDCDDAGVCVVCGTEC